MLGCSWQKIPGTEVLAIELSEVLLHIASLGAHTMESYRIIGQTIAW